MIVLSGELCYNNNIRLRRSLMDIGRAIRELRQERGVTQEQLAQALSVSVQTVSRWENNVNAPDLSMLPQLAVYFKVTADHLLGLERNDTMAKLIKTTETFELASKQEAEEMVLKFKGEKFPVLKDFRITESGDKTILEVTKEFNTELENMKFN